MEKIVKVNVIERDFRSYDIVATNAKDQKEVIGLKIGDYPLCVFNDYWICWSDETGGYIGVPEVYVIAYNIESKKTYRPMRERGRTVSKLKIDGNLLTVRWYKPWSSDEGPAREIDLSELLV